MKPRSMPPAFLGACAVLLAFLVVSVFIPRPVEDYPARANFSRFPLKLGEWSGRGQTLEGVYLDALKLDDYMLADYSNGTAPPVNLYIAYYNSQRKGEAVHSPRSCLPGGGWQLRDFNQKTLANIEINGAPLRVNRTLIELGNQRQLVYYWFQQRGRVVTNEFAVKWYLFWDALTRHRTDGALVRLITALPPSSDERDADKRLTLLAAQVVPLLTPYVPN